VGSISFIQLGHIDYEHNSTSFSDQISHAKMCLSYHKEAIVSPISFVNLKDKYILFCIQRGSTHPNEQLLITIRAFELKIKVDEYFSSIKTQNKIISSLWILKASLSKTENSSVKLNNKET
jgi:hypothetical protein